MALVEVLLEVSLVTMASPVTAAAEVGLMSLVLFFFTVVVSKAEELVSEPVFFLRGS